MELKILHEDPHLIVCVKPPKIPSQPDPTGDLDMLTILEGHLKKNYPNVKKPYLGLVHRLDRPVGGIMVFAKTKEANAFLSKQLQDKTFVKKYLSVVTGNPEGDSGELRDYLIKLPRVNMSKVVDKDIKGAKEGVLEYKVLGRVVDQEYGTLTLMEILLKTGRHHQIRVQLSNRGWGIWGDNKYNNLFIKKQGWSQIALWSYQLQFIHPKRKKLVTFENYPDVYPFSLFI
ncbi:23S rRNA pseudouridine1911/1915/1917 synthase [Anaerobranca californiensis DSM 14826]|jgi:23S rRNA pseudouridine1911/1915/1917 synthase|uniref:RNA pseudouridylate synthase n=1 Tax=Anaerobranca californiensis DSM 14826 TaxID=1120989 RepID=A0A1M6MUE6_9FIRM|nr:RNA pseudouridine synthase [Anaerobranca californiensis]SHJ87042.1 23S rRNA pseudouridine1911/1915/1917 synthase [Anaerobranca californiensis DSM 14826]